MDDVPNYTPLNPDKLASSKKSFKIPNKVLIGLIMFFMLGIGTVGYLMTQEQFQTQVPAQVEPTTILLPSPTVEVLEPTIEPTLEADLTEQGEDSEPTADETLLAQENLAEPTDEPSPTEEPSPTQDPTPTDELTPTEGDGVGRGGVGDPSPTETILALNSTATPMDEGGEEEEPTEAARPSEIPSAGMATFSGIFAVLSIGVIILGFVL